MPEEIKDKGGGRHSDAVAQQTRQRIVQSARAIFAARGFDGVSLRDIAGHAGVTHGLLRHHFGAKEDIWRAVIDATLAEYLAVIVPLLADAGRHERAPIDIVKAASRIVIVFAARYPEVPRLMMHEAVEGGPRLTYFLEQMLPIRALIAPLFDAVKQEGYLPQFSHGTFLLALFMLGAMPFAVAAFSNQLCGSDILAADEVELHADRVIATLFPEA